MDFGTDVLEFETDDKKKSVTIEDPLPSSAAPPPSFEFQIEEDIHNLPKVQTWKHRPVFFAPGRNMKHVSVENLDLSNHHSLSLGEPIPFETDMFQGKILLRVKGIHQNVSQDHADYFQDKKRVKHVVIQGQFKEKLQMSDVWYGDIYEKPQRMSKMVARFVMPFFQKLVPGIMIDFHSKQNHKVLVRASGDTRTLSINKPGEEPDISSHDLPENIELLGEAATDLTTIKQRQKHLRKQKPSSKYEYDPNLVYTFQFYDDVIDFATYSANMGKMGTICIKDTMNGNPFSLNMCCTNGQEIFRFNIFHEVLVEYKDQTVDQRKRSIYLSMKNNRKSLRQSSKLARSVMKSYFKKR